MADAAPGRSPHRARRRGAARHRPRLAACIYTLHRRKRYLADASARTAGHPPWPAELPQQIAAVAGVLAASAAPLDLDALAGHFTDKCPWKKRLPQLLDTLAALGRARCDDQRWRSV